MRPRAASGARDVQRGGLNWAGRLLLRHAVAPARQHAAVQPELGGEIPGGTLAGSACARTGLCGFAAGCLVGGASKVACRAVAGPASQEEAPRDSRSPLSNKSLQKHKMLPGGAVSMQHNRDAFARPRALAGTNPDLWSPNRCSLNSTGSFACCAPASAETPPSLLAGAGVPACAAPAA